MRKIGFWFVTLALSITVHMQGNATAQPQEITKPKTALHYGWQAVDGINLFFREGGPENAPTLVLLHGSPTSSIMYQAVMEQLISSNPDITAVYAENDEMALGAVTALKAANKNPGKDVKIVSIDGTKNAVQAIVDGTINAVIESNPRFGPLAFKTALDFYNGTAISENVIIEDREYDTANAQSSLSSAY